MVFRKSIKSLELMLLADLVLQQNLILYLILLVSCFLENHGFSNVFMVDQYNNLVAVGNSSKFSVTS